MKILQYCSLAFMAVLGAASCSLENGGRVLPAGEGIVDINFGYDLDVSAVTKASVGEDNPIFQLQIKNIEKDVIVKTIDDHTTINGSVTLKEGRYEIKASNGVEQAAAFEAPYYEGRDTVTVIAGETVSSSIVCTLAGVKVTVEVTDAVKKNFREYGVTVSNGNGGSLLFKDEDFSKAGYFVNTGTLFCTLDIVNNDGKQSAITHQIDGVKPRDYYHLKFDVDTTANREQGGMSIVLTIDDTYNEKEHHIEVNLDKEPAPVITESSGADLSAVLKAPQGAGLLGRFMIHSEAGIERIVITHSSSDMFALGIPETFNPMDEAIDSTVFKSNGMHWTHPIVKGTTEAYFDFRTLFAEKLPLGTYEFTFNILDTQAQFVSKKVTLQVIPDMEVSTAGIDAWAKFAYVYGQYNTETEPVGMGVQYKKVADTEWIDWNGTFVKDGNTFRALITGLEPETAYSFRAVSTKDLSEGKSDDNVVTVVTEAMTQLPNFSFDNWYKDGKHWYPNADISVDNYFWDSGNRGANTIGENNPTSPEESFVISGKAVRMETKTVFGVMAGGNIYTGSFGDVQGMSGATVNFGRPYTGRPTTLNGYYCYAPKVIDKTKAPYENLKGQNDIGKIFVVLTDMTSPFVVNNATNPPTLFDPSDKSVIAYGELEDNVGTNGEYKQFCINLEYRDNRKPSYIILVAVASKYADYFTGGVGSIMYIDEFNFGFDYVE